MDPLSITASTITLLEATTRAYRFLSTIPQAEVRFAELCNELDRLTDVLQSINAMKIEAQRDILAFSNVDQDLWKQSELACADCEKTLTELTALVERIRSSRSSRTLLRRMRLAKDLRLQAKDLASFKEKIQTSNTSFQTLLQVLNVSLSMRNNKSNQEIVKELKELKRVIDASHCATADSSFSFIHNLSHKRLMNNQRRLIRAAQSFYSTASSTASTREGTSDGSQVTSSKLLDTRAPVWSTVGSGIFSLSSQKRRRIEDYIKNNHHSATETSLPRLQSGQDTTSQQYYHAANNTVHESIQIRAAAPQRLANLSIDDVHVDGLTLKSDFDSDNILYVGLRKMADRSILGHDFAKAEEVLRQALRQGTTFAQDDPRQIRMRTQLVLIGFLQGNGRDMEASVLDLAKFHVSKAIANQLVYILILAHVLEKDHESSQRLLPELLESSSSSGVVVSPTEIEKMQLWAASCRLAGDCLKGEAIEEVFTTLKEKALPTVSDFILDSEVLLFELIGPRQDLHILFKRKLTETERLRQSSRTLRIRWLQERPNKAADGKGSTHIIRITDSDTDRGIESESDDEMRVDGNLSSKDNLNSYNMSKVSESKENKTNPSKWWRKAKLVGRPFTNVRKAIPRIGKNLGTAQSELEKVHEAALFLDMPWHTSGVDKAGPIFTNLIIQDPDCTSSPLTHADTMESQTVRRLSFEGEPGTLSFERAEVLGTCYTNFLAELDATVPGPDPTPFNCSQPSPKSTHNGILLDISKGPRFRGRLLYDPPTIVQTLADNMAMLRLKRAVFLLYVDQVNEGRRSGTPDSGYETTHSAGFVAPSHERFLRKLLGLKLSIPVLSLGSAIETSLKDVNSSKLPETHRVVEHEEETGTKEARRKAILLKNQEKKTEEYNEIKVSREAKVSGQASRETDPSIFAIGTSEKHGAVSKSKSSIPRPVSSLAKRFDQLAKYGYEQAADNSSFGNGSWKLPDEDHVCARQKCSVEQEKHGPHITFQKGTRWLMSGALRKEATSSASTSHVRNR